VEAPEIRVVRVDFATLLDGMGRKLRIRREVGRRAKLFEQLKRGFDVPRTRNQKVHVRLAQPTPHSRRGVVDCEVFSEYAAARAQTHETE
jgi:hypothetical protein